MGFLISLNFSFSLDQYIFLLRLQFSLRQELLFFLNTEVKNSSLNMTPYWRERFVFELYLQKVAPYAPSSKSDALSRSNLFVKRCYNHKPKMSR